MVADLATLSSGIAQARYNEIARARTKYPGMRIALMVPVSVSNLEAHTLVRGPDQIVFWPFASIYPKG